MQNPKMEIARTTADVQLESLIGLPPLFVLPPPPPPLVLVDFHALYISIRMRKSRASLAELKAMLGVDGGVVASGCMAVLLLMGVPGLLPMNRARAEGLARPSFTSLVEAASAGDAFAQFVVGTLHSEGIGTVLVLVPTAA
jgi:hypothetical protein